MRKPSIVKITRNMLPNVPDEVFRMFIEPLNDDTPNVFDSQPEGRWFYHLGKLSIEEFNNLLWEVRPIVIKRAGFHPESKFDIYNLVSYCLIDSEREARARFPGYPTDSRKRLKWHAEFIVNTGKLFAPIATIRTADGLRVLDGAHRVSAAVLTNKNMSIDAWIGEHA